MTIYKKRTKFRIEKLLSEIRGAKSELTRELNVTPQAMNNFFKRGARTVGKQKEITKAFNEAFETNFSNKELFSLSDK